MVDHVSGAVVAVLTRKAVNQSQRDQSDGGFGCQLGKTDIILKSDGEESSQAFSDVSETPVRHRRLCRTVWVGSHGSNGVVERMMQKVTGLVRCLGIPIRTATAVVQGPNHPIIGGVRHAAWLFTLIQVKSSGNTWHSSAGSDSSCGEHTCVYARMRTFFSCIVHASLVEEYIFIQNRFNQTTLSSNLSLAKTRFIQEQFHPSDRSKNTFIQ